jgi:hypothetical protein
MAANRNSWRANFRIGKKYYKESKNIKKNTTIGYIYVNKALDKNYNGFNWYLNSVYYFGTVYKKDPKTAIDLIMALENNM